MVKEQKVKEDSIDIGAEGRTRLEALYKSLVAEEITVTMEQLFEKYTEYRISMDERTAIFAVINEYRKTKAVKLFQSSRKRNTNVATVYGFIVGTRGLWDKADQIRNTAKRFIKNHSLEAAKEQGFVDGDNQILDTRQTIFGRPNTKYGQVLHPKLKVLDLLLYGFFRHNGDKKFKFGTLQTSDNAIAMAWDRDIIQSGRFFKPCQVTVIVKEETDDELTLTASTAEETKSVFRAVNEEWDVGKIVDDAMVPLLSKIEDVEGYFMQHSKNGKAEWNARVFVKGIVAFMNTDRVDALGMIPMGVMDPTNEDKLIKVRVNPSTTSLDFGELSEVYVFGKPSRSMFKDRENDNKLMEGDVVIDAYGVYATVKIPRVGAGPGEDAEYDIPQVEGWLA